MSAAGVFGLLINPGDLEPPRSRGHERGTSTTSKVIVIPTPSGEAHESFLVTVADVNNDLVFHWRWIRGDGKTRRC